MIKGMDVSSYQEMKDRGYHYYDAAGQEMDVLALAAEMGFNYARVRLWNEPENVPESGGYCGLPQTLALAKKLKAQGFPYLLDFHYSDWWADPEHQNIPKAWGGLSVEQTAEQLYQFTRGSLLALKEADVYPDSIQIGNEIRNGMLFPLAQTPNWENLAKLVQAGLAAARSVNPATTLVLHLDEGARYAYYETWFDRMLALGTTDFDCIGLSYYPYIHGTFADFSDNLHRLAERYGKELIVAEYAHPFRRSRGSYIGEKEEKLAGYPAAPAGQRESMERLVKIIKDVPACQGFFYWEPFLRVVSDTEESWGTFMELMDDDGRPTEALCALAAL